MITYQDFEAAQNRAEFIARAITEHMSSDAYKTAVDADAYDHQRDVTVNNYTRFIAEHAGGMVNATAANNKISSNFFHRLNTQRCTYLLGNGVSFSDHHEERDGEDVDLTKDALGRWFDNDFYTLAYFALIHGESFGFWNLDRLHVFTLTEFVPLYDETTGALRAGIRFWRLSESKPMTAVLYEEDGYTKYKSRKGSMTLAFDEVEAKRGYKARVVRTEADGERIEGYENYSTLPIFRMLGSRLHQSTLVGMREQIDSFDLIQSGFANDLQDCAQIYWIVENCGGMSDEDLKDFLGRLQKDHIANADTQSMGAETGSLKPYVQDVPFESRRAWLEHIRSAIYEGFGALDVHTISADAKTATEIEAAYQPLDEHADDLEYQCIDFLLQLLRMLGIDDMPRFKRNRITNQMEQTQMVMMAANYLDDRTVLEKLPWISVDEVDGILARKDAEDGGRFEPAPEPAPEPAEGLQEPTEV